MRLVLFIPRSISPISLPSTLHCPSPISIFGPVFSRITNIGPTPGTIASTKPAPTMARELLNEGLQRPRRRRRPTRGRPKRSIPLSFAWRIKLIAAPLEHIFRGWTKEVLKRTTKGVSSHRYLSLFDYIALDR